MGQGALLAVAAALTRGVRLAAVVVALATAVTAQGPAYRERWSYLHLEARRVEVQRELAGRDVAAHDRVAELLCEPHQGVPFRPLANALAYLRGVEPDDAWLLRCTIAMFVLPEVSDPDAANAICRAAHVSVLLPYTVPLPGPLAFAISVRDAHGDVVWSHELADVDARDLRLGQPSVEVPSASLADGAYRVRCETRIGGAGPRPGDPQCEWTFHVLRGYQARAERAMATAREVAGTLPPADHAWLGGATAAVQRAFTGEPWAVASDAVRDLERLERVLANVDAERAIDDGLGGDAMLALPVPGGAPLRCTLRPARGAAAQPLVVFAGAAPAFDPGLDRPVAPSSRDPAWLAHELAGFGDGRWHVAFLESPGVGRDYAPALRGALELLPRITGAGDAKPLLVVEREAATIVALRLAEFRQLVCGLVLVGGGGIPGPALLANGDLPVRVAAARGAGEEPLQRVIDFVALQQQRGTWHGDVAWLSPRRPPWTAAVPLLARELEAFARECFAR